MAWDRNDFLAILTTQIGKQLLNDCEINEYTQLWSEDNKAALLHANGITEHSDFDQAKQLLQLVSAFAKKDITRLKALVDDGVSVGARLDYLLPLHDLNYQAGEDVFVTTTKVMLGGSKNKDAQLVLGDMKHLIGKDKGNLYLENELKEIEDYVNNSFEIQAILQKAPNKTIIQPTPQAIQYMIENAQTYRDSNQNPLIVSIPGAISIENHSVKDLIISAIKYGAFVDDIGFFGVSGIVWSIILADVNAVQFFLECDANTNMQDEMQNLSVIAWVNSTLTAMRDNEEYCNRLNVINKDIIKHQGNKLLNEQVNQLSPLLNNSHFKLTSTHTTQGDANLSPIISNSSRGLSIIK